MFVNGLNNFGYWKENPQSFISDAQRFESGKDLYREVAKSLKITNLDEVLEIGCGYGVGSALIFHEFSPKSFDALDISEERIAKAKEVHESNQLKFCVGDAEKLPWKNGSFTKIFSIEAIQHFDSTEGFLLETFRVLKFGGKFTVASIFTSSLASSSEAETLLPFKVGIVRWIPLNDLSLAIKKAGFKKVQVTKIGDFVWEPIKQWILQNHLPLPWCNWYEGYTKKLYDYYIVSADKL